MCSLGCWLGRWRPCASLRRDGLLRLARVADPPEPLQVTDGPGTQPNLGFPPGAFVQAGFLSHEPDEPCGMSLSRSTRGRPRITDRSSREVRFQVRICGCPILSIASSVITTNLTPLSAGIVRSDKIVMTAQSQRQPLLQHRDTFTAAAPNCCQVRGEWALPAQFG